MLLESYGRYERGGLCTVKHSLIMALILAGTLTLHRVHGEDAAGGPHVAMPQKMQTLQEQVQRWQKDGRDLTPLHAIMDQFEALMKDGKAADAEAVLDRAMKLLSDADKANLEQKMKTLQEGIQRWQQDGKTKEAEALLDLAIKVVGDKPAAQAGPPPAALQQKMRTFQEHVQQCPFTGRSYPRSESNMFSANCER